MTLRQLSWKGSDSKKFRLQQCEADGCIWKVLDDSNTLRGTLGVYVDDLLIMVEHAKLNGAIQAVRSIWECSATAFADSEHGLNFCGIQVIQRKDCLWIHQEKYIDELGSRYPHLKPSLYLPDFKAAPESENPSPGGVRAAQKK